MLFSLFLHVFHSLVSLFLPCRKQPPLALFIVRIDWISDDSMLGFLSMNFKTSSIICLILISSESSTILTSYDSTFARENIRLEKDVLSKLGVRSNCNCWQVEIEVRKTSSRVQVNCMSIRWDLDFGHRLKIPVRSSMQIDII